MSDRGTWIRFERHGGVPPRDDEALRIAGDGSFTARRTIGGRRIGTFGGRIAARPLARLQALVEAIGAGEDVTLPTPGHGATETLATTGRTIRLGSNEAPPQPWRPLVARVRKLLVDEVVDRPLAAIELVADARSARLTHAGSQPIEVDLGSVSVRVVRTGADDLPTGRWSGVAKGAVNDGERLVPTAAWVTALPGWGASLPFAHGLAMGPGDRLQVWVEVDIRQADASRRGQLYAPVASDD